MNKTFGTYGKRRWITMPKGTTKKKATEKLREVEDQLRRGIYLPDKKIPTFKQVAKDWVEFKKPNLRHSRWSVYEGHTRNHFYDFHPLRINRITTAKVEKWITTRHIEGMNIGTIKKILVTMGRLWLMRSGMDTLTITLFGMLKDLKVMGKQRIAKPEVWHLLQLMPS